jgi:hypothetical protein
LYEHYFIRLNKNGAWLDDMSSPGVGLGPDLPFYDAIYKENDIDSESIKKYFFSDKYQDSFLYCRFVRSIYMMRLEDTKNQLYKVKNSLESFLKVSIN